MSDAGDIRLKRQLVVDSSAITIDPLEFMRRTVPQKTLIHAKSDTNPEASHQSFMEPFDGRFYYVKDIVPRNPGRNYERWGWDNEKVWLERDTAWPDPPQTPEKCKAMNAFDCREYGDRVFARRPTQAGAVETVKSRITAFRGGACEYDEECSYVREERQQILYEHRAYGGMICPDLDQTLECMGIKQYDPDGTAIEIFWYARGWGWVEWVNLRPGAVSKVWNTYDGDAQRPRKPVWTCDGLGEAPGPIQRSTSSPRQATSSRPGRLRSSSSGARRATTSRCATPAARPGSAQTSHACRSRCEAWLSASQT